ILFVDEVHRFNKSQQDAFLPHVESGLFVFVGATTENPSFEVNSALLSGAAGKVLNNREIVARAAAQQKSTEIDGALLGSALAENLRRFDKGGDAFYDQISA